MDNSTPEEPKVESSTPAAQTPEGTSTTPSAPQKPFIKRAKKRHKPVCMLCKWGFLHADYKDVEFLKKKFLKNNKIITHKITGNCLKHQHQVATAIKRARVVALLPFVEE